MRYRANRILLNRKMAVAAGGSLSDRRPNWSPHGHAMDFRNLTVPSRHRAGLGETGEKDSTMQSRLNPYRAAPAAMKALGVLDEEIGAIGLESSLVHLVRTRASQVNGCAYCIHLHTREARRDGETEDRLYMLDAWRESSLYTDRERAALGWTEAVTLIADTHAPDEAWEELRLQFSDAEMVTLTVLIATINAWNRVGIGFRALHPTSAPATAS